VRDALSRGRTFAIATLRPGWERDYHGSPAFHPLGCIARIETIEWLPNDCYDLVVSGTERIRFGTVAREFPYRACHAERLPVTPYDADDPLAGMERHALLEAAKPLLASGPEAWFAPPEVADDAPFEAVVNTLAQTLRIDTSARLELLALDGVFERAQRLHEHLRRMQLTLPRESEGEAGRN